MGTLRMGCTVQSLITKHQIWLFLENLFQPQPPFLKIDFFARLGLRIRLADALK